jgi:hypothetical protein
MGFLFIKAKTRQFAYLFYFTAGPESYHIFLNFGIVFLYEVRLEKC